MRIQIVNFNLKGLGQKAYGELCAGLAPALSDVPGLISKVWISDPETNTYGGVYLWQSAEAMAAFGESDLFAQIKANPHFTHLTWGPDSSVAG